jgi:DNA-binding Xre family transcriptional regulator|tara:strand:- start:258 stop:470 length:213 start_codon:yes stop_codon:yes gene_type:complete
MTCRFDFGKSLRLAQVKLGVSSSELASDMGITKQQVSQWRYREDAKLSLVVKVCKHLKIDVYDFLRLASE